MPAGAAFNILRRRTNQQIYVLGRSDQPMKTHGGGANQNILEALVLESTQCSQKLITIHASLLQPDILLIQSHPLSGLLRVPIRLLDNASKYRAQIQFLIRFFLCKILLRPDAG